MFDKEKNINPWLLADGSTIFREHQLSELEKLLTQEKVLKNFYNTNVELICPLCDYNHLFTIIDSDVDELKNKISSHFSEVCLLGADKILFALKSSLESLTSSKFVAWVLNIFPDKTFLDQKRLLLDKKIIPQFIVKGNNLGEWSVMFFIDRDRSQNAYSMPLEKFLLLERADIVSSASG